MIEFNTKEKNHTTLTLYSNSGDRDKLNAFIRKNKSSLVVSFDIIHRASKEQDELASKFINETLDGI